MDTSWASKVPPAVPRLIGGTAAFGREPATEKGESSSGEDSSTEDSRESEESISDSEDDEDIRYKLAYPTEYTAGEQPTGGPLRKPTSESSCSSLGPKRTAIGQIDVLQGPEAPRQNLGSKPIPGNQQEIPIRLDAALNEPLPQREKKPPDRPRRQRKPPDRYSPHK